MTASSTLVDRLEAALAKKYPALHAALPAGASAAALERLEAAAGRALPASLRRLYERHDGSAGELYGGYLLLSVDAMLRVRDQMNRLLAKKPAWRTSGWWDLRWLPFLDDQGGNLYCLDGAGAFGGAVGQVIRFEHETGPAVGFAGVDAWIETMRAMIAKRALVDGDDDLFHAIYQKKNPGFPHTGNRAGKALEDELRRLYNDQKYPQMVKRARAGLASAPRDAELWRSLGLALMALDRHEEALEALNQELAIVPPTTAPRFRIYLHKAEMLSALERDDEAVATIEIVLGFELDRYDRESAYQLLFTAHARQGRAAEAARAFAKWEKASAAAWGPKGFDFEVWWDYGNGLKGAARKKIMQRGRAGTEQRLAVERDDDVVTDAHNHLVYFCCELGDAAAALRHLRDAVARRPSIARHARKDRDLAPLWREREFSKICGGPGGK